MEVFIQERLFKPGLKILRYVIGFEMGSDQGEALTIKDLCQKQSRFFGL